MHSGWSDSTLVAKPVCKWPARSKNGPVTTSFSWMLSYWPCCQDICQRILKRYFLWFSVGCTGAVSYNLTSDTEIDNPEVECKAWHRSQLESRELFRETLNRMRPCPCSARFLWWDRYFNTELIFRRGNTMYVPLMPSSRYYPYGKVNILFSWVFAMTLVFMP